MVRLPLWAFVVLIVISLTVWSLDKIRNRDRFK